MHQETEVVVDNADVGRTTSSNGQPDGADDYWGSKIDWRSRSLERNPTRRQPFIWRKALNDDDLGVDFQYGGPRHLGFCRIRVLSSPGTLERYSRCLYQFWCIRSKMAEFLPFNCRAPYIGASRCHLCNSSVIGVVSCISYHSYETKISHVGLRSLITFTVILVVCCDFRLSPWSCVTALKVSVVCSAFERSRGKPCCGRETARYRCKIRFVTK